VGTTALGGGESVRLPTRIVEAGGADRTWRRHLGNGEGTLGAEELGGWICAVVGTRRICDRPTAGVGVIEHRRREATIWPQADIDEAGTYDASGAFGTVIVALQCGLSTRTGSVCWRIWPQRKGVARADQRRPLDKLQTGIAIAVGRLTVHCHATPLDHEPAATVTGIALEGCRGRGRQENRTQGHNQYNHEFVSHEGNRTMSSRCPLVVDAVQSA